MFDFDDLPFEIKLAMWKSTPIELLSLEDTPKKLDSEGDERELFHRYKVLGRVALTGPLKRESLVAIRKSFATAHLSKAAIFKPSYGIRVRGGFHIYDFLLSMENWQTILYCDDSVERQMAVTESPRGILNKILLSSQVKLNSDEEAWETRNQP